MSRPVDSFRHEALMYSGTSEFLAGTIPFIQHGLAAGEPVLVVERPEKIALLKEGLDSDAPYVHFADMAEIGANPGRIIPAWRDFVTKHGGGGQRLRGIGEPIWDSRSPAELVECQRHESLLNVAFRADERWWLLCPYDTATLDPAIIDEARRSHPFVMQGGARRESSDFRGLGPSGAPFRAPLPDPGGRVEELVFEAGSLLAVRAQVARFATAAGLEPARIAQLVMAVNEVATNSLKHGGGKGTLRIWSGSGEVSCEVRDAGRFDRPLVDRERPGRDAGASRGLWLANQLCDLVQIRSVADGTAVRLHMQLGIVAAPPRPHTNGTVRRS